eukprot:scaffold5126_cov125-Isochrysis_galbana.AAC.4
MAYSVRGAIACTRLSLEAERLSLGPPDLQLPAQLQWVNVLKLEGSRKWTAFCCGSKGGCSDSRRGLCCTHIPCLEPELWQVWSAEGSSALCKPGRAHRAVARAGFLHLCCALFGAVHADALGTLVRGRIRLDGLQPELARRHCAPPRARGVFFSRGYSKGP